MAVLLLDFEALAEEGHLRLQFLKADAVPEGGIRVKGGGHHPNAALVVRGIIDQKKAEKHAGMTYDAAALKTAVPGIVLRDNVGVNAADTE